MDSSIKELSFNEKITFIRKYRFENLINRITFVT